MAEKVSRRHAAAILDESRQLIEQAKRNVHRALQVCEATKADRRMSVRRTKRLLEVLDRATEDLGMLKARIDKAEEDELGPKLRRRG